MKRIILYRIMPWRGFNSGRIYYRIERCNFFLWRKVVDCFSEQEAESMLSKLRSGWDEASTLSQADQKT